MDDFLFAGMEGEAGQPSPAEVAAEAAGGAAGTPRLRVPQRDQVEFRWASLEEMLEPDHPARIVWAAVCRLDLSGWLHRIKAVEGQAGRDATDPRLLLALWVYATVQGVGSARELDRFRGRVAGRRRRILLATGEAPVSTGRDAHLPQRRECLSGVTAGHRPPSRIFARFPCQPFVSESR